MTEVPLCQLGDTYVPTYLAVLVRPDFDPFHTAIIAPLVGRVIATVITAPTARPNTHSRFWGWYSRHLEDKSLVDKKGVALSSTARYSNLIERGEESICGKIQCSGRFRTWCSYERCRFMMLDRRIKERQNERRPKPSFKENVFARRSFHRRTLRCTEMLKSWPKH
ncbi:uncharacterized protein Bfra_001788 [Botrytis fragariae]|uniref:Uncharacterized protein n=1 Tax=Botrytis fragariae TaxID=1964551 RepID=A0A8H6B0Z8_9HELO|nr:uncharacterized protein Bfra_001788 [Botrytis fragariae]KAF5877421.1 hypothetical protein Bfra_001788 [Botrytis fragariae]